MKRSPPLTDDTAAGLPVDVDVGTRVCIRAAVACVAALATSVSGQTPDSLRPIAVRVIGIFDSRTGEALPGVVVRDALSGSYVVTSSTGTAQLNFLTFRGAATFVELRKLGYQAKQILVDRADSASITELLDPVVALPPVVTTEKYQIALDAGGWDGFDARCQTKSVTCIRNEDLEKKPAANLADFLIRADGMTIGSCGRRQQEMERAAQRTVREDRDAVDGDTSVLFPADVFR